MKMYYLADVFMTAKRYKPQQRRLRPKHSRLKKLLKNRFFWFGILGLFVLGGIGYGIFFTTVFQIKHIEVQGTEKTSAEKLTEITKEHIGKKFVFFKTNHLFLANAGAVVKEIENRFPEIEQVEVDPRFPDKVRVTVKERGGVAVWCQQKSYTVEVSDSPEGGEEQASRSFRQCFALDSNGVIFEEQEAGRQLIIQNNTNNAAIGDRVVEPEILQTMFAFREEIDSSKLFEEVGLRISSFTIVSAERINARISEGWEIYFNPAENIDWQTTKANLVLEQEIPFEKRPSLEYIDLRFGDQAYLKYK